MTYFINAAWYGVDKPVVLLGKPRLLCPQVLNSVGAGVSHLPLVNTSKFLYEVQVSLLVIQAEWHHHHH